MRLRIEEDLFLHRQPEMAFIEDLKKPLHTETPPGWNKRRPKENEVFIESLTLVGAFPDPEGLLVTAYEDFGRFMKSAGIREGAGFRIVTEQGKTECREAYRILITPEECRLIAADTEGIRRALIYLEDEMQRREGSLLPLGAIERRPFIKTRISRCFFAPPSHASNLGMENELASDIDYYPDEYLNRLAHDGINALWLGVTFRELLPSRVIPEFGTDGERRLKKLNEVVAKCRRYGIAIYIFCSEPASTFRNPIPFEKHKDVLGGLFWPAKNAWTFCHISEKGAAYVEEAFTTLFRRVPNLGGLMMITTGETTSSCGSVPRMLCPRCRERFGTVGKTLADLERTVRDIMDREAPDAEFISWTYSQRAWKRELIEETCEERDPRVIHMQNFEDLCEVEQLGKTRLAADYWLSVVGPGRIFSQSLEINRRRGVRMFAKIQACSSHEISTVPYVPAPGILYDKYKFMYENGITGVVHCWYFGNYPCLMNKAACELSFLPRFENKHEFLVHLAGIAWGQSHAEQVATAWEAIEKGYREFPVNIAFEWLGPMQDSPSSPLHLLPADLPMPSTWLLGDGNPSGGDRIGECMLNGHTEEECVTLTGRVADGARRGAAIIASLPDGGYGERTEQKSVAEALALIFESGHNVVRFYTLRRLLGIGKGDVSGILDEMEAIARREIEISRALIPITAADSRIGYHSEAHGYKIFPDKLAWRIGEVERVLREEFPALRRRIADGLYPLAFYRGEEEGARRYLIAHAPVESCEWMDFLQKDGTPDPATSIRVAETEDGYCLEVRILDGEDTVWFRPEFRMFHPSLPFGVSSLGIPIENDLQYSVYDNRAREIKARFTYAARECEGGKIYTLTFRRADFDMEKGEPFRLSATRAGRGTVLSLPDRMFSRLIQGSYSPDSYAFFVPEA
ncbi:MAG: hypothetical protein J6T24_00480 [Clostridia bacterium]|nr:hypothetical protein [Clostridia bacterium]